MGRFPSVAVALLLLVPAGCAPDRIQPDDRTGEQVFESVEKRLLQARSVHIEFTTTLAESTDSVAGSLIVADGAKVALRLEGTFAGGPLRMSLLSDGQRARLDLSIKDFPPQQEVVATPADLGAMHLRSWLRKGVIGALLPKVTTYGPHGKPSNPTPIEGTLRLVRGKQADLAGRRPIPLEFLHQDRVISVLWIDPALEVPLKRVLSPSGVEWTETYSKVLLDPAVDPTAFRLPRD